jgi:dsRNA-specific ribonuclease
VVCASTARSFSSASPSRSLETSSPSSSSSSPFPPTSNQRQGQHLFNPSPSSQSSFLTSLLAPLGTLPNPQLLLEDEALAAKALTHKSGVDKRRAYGRREVEQKGQHGATEHNEKLAFIGTSLFPRLPALPFTGSGSAAAEMSSLTSR